MQAVDEFRSAAEKVRIAAEAETEARLSAEERARREREERALWEQLSDEAEQTKLSLAAQLQMLHAAAAAAPPQATATIIAQAEVAAAAIDIDEASTRTLIDAHVRARGREVDTLTLRHSCGVRPAKGSNTAIAEWPTKAARRTTHFSSGCAASPSSRQSGKTRTSRPSSVRRSATRAGFGLRGCGQGFYHRRALMDWPTPEALQGLLEIDAEAAQTEPPRVPEARRVCILRHSRTFTWACANVGTNRPVTSRHHLTAPASRSSLLKSNTQALVPEAAFRAAVVDDV